ncbi:hypothetical protein X948_2331 [Burkholderia pseudomallei MSHR5608]|nr:hypothetical protein X948_2331 [Burkholderia pseudomallei MSHR5608]
MPSASGAFARRRPGRRGVASRARACEAALAAVARRAPSDACPTVASIRQSRAAARRACEDIAGDPNGRRGGRRRRVGRWGGIGGDNRYRRVGPRAPVVSRLRWAGLRRALGGAWCPPAVGHGGGAPSAERRASRIHASLIAHRSSRGREPRVARSASCVRFVCRLGESTGEMTNEPAGETVSESMGETAAEPAGESAPHAGRTGASGTSGTSGTSGAHIERARRIGASIQPIESRSRFRAVPRMRDFKAFLKQQRRARRPRRAPQQAHEPA